MVGSTVVLALDEPLLDPDSKKETILRGLNTTFTICFIVEGALKVISQLSISIEICYEDHFDGFSL